ncbi:MAG: insulinase family protein [Candidatus Omnitrophica bacterium]|nr:insulinase family protein [Candidatus Omnitrophota bacterium]
MRRTFTGFLTVVFFLSFSFSSPAFEGWSTRRILDNGLTVLVTEIPSSPVVSVYALVKTGSATEGKYLGAGISHFLEHMVFKGTHKRNVGELAARIQSVGGTINAVTAMDYTVYTITVPDNAFNVALDILSDMLANATMDSGEVERERDVIYSEMRMREDDPDSKINELTFQNVFIRHPYRYPVIGYKPLLAEVTRDDLLQYYGERYVPNNTVLSVAGNVNSEGAFLKVEETFKGFERGHPVVRHLPPEPKQVSRRRYDEEYPTDLTRLSISFSGIELLHPDLYALDVLAKILGEGESSRFYREIYKQQGLVHRISAANYTPIDKGIFWISCLLDEKNVEAVIRAVLKQVDAVKADGVEASELQKAKQQVRSEYVLEHKTSASIAFSQALDEAFSGDPNFSKRYVEGIERVSLDDIKRVANTYLVDTGLTTVILKPEEQKAERRPESEVSVKEEIQRHVLDNGLTVLLKEDHTFPLVDIRLAANGGVRQETEELNGLFHMMASMWTKGTARYSADEIAEKTESLGMMLSGFSGRNSFGLSMEFLTEQLPTALNLLKELVLHPTFPEAEIVKVKGQMKTIIRQRQDDIFDSTAHELKTKLFLTHPFRLEDEGTFESIDRITRDDLTVYYNRFAVPGNMVISVFGDIDPKKVLNDIKEGFGALKDKKLSLKTYHEDPPDRPREETLAMNKEQAMVMYGFQGVSFGDQDCYGLEVLTAVLGSSFNGRLFTNIRDQLGSAYTLGGHFIPGPDAGFVYFYVLTEAEKASMVKKLLKNQISTLQNEMVSDQELKDIKTFLIGTFKASQETNASLSFMVSLDELYGLGFDRYQQYKKRIEDVTREDIQRLAREYFDLNKAAIVQVMPEKTAP